MLKKKLSLKIISALTFAAALSSALPAYAVSENGNLANESGKAVSTVSLESKDTSAKDVKAEKQNDTSDVLIDSAEKDFFNLDKVEKYLGFEYKVPSYIVDGYKVSSEIKVNKLDDGTKMLAISYGKTGMNNGYIFDVMKDDPKDILAARFKESFANADLKVDQAKIKGISGEYITLTDTSVSDKTKAECEKYFAFQNNDIWYVLYCQDNSNVILNADEIAKIANSLTEPSKITDKSYVVENPMYDFSGYTVYIYDKDDLSEAKESLGFNFKLPLSISENSKLDSSFTNAKDNDKRLFSYYIVDTANQADIVLIQSNDDYYGYEDIASTGYGKENGGNGKIKADKLSLSGADVYRYKDAGDNKIVYEWKENNLYYFFEVYYNANSTIGTADEMVKNVIDSKLA